MNKKTKDQEKYTPTIGLETHIELKTVSKMFCGCQANHFGKKPNTQTCPVCLGLPGALPNPNRRAVEWTILIGLALNCKIALKSKFDRKHYFYPDLPKGYQISQYDEPLCYGGYLDTNEGRIGITRVHLEEDTGKLQHTSLKGKKVTLIDFNRSGVPLVEIVTKPDIRSGLQAKEYAQKLQQTVRYLAVSDCDMEKGSMRLEANISQGLSLGYKVEVKNLNSFRFVEKAIEYELIRQKKVLVEDKTPIQETRGWNEIKNETFSQRIKETAADYRYFPEPDIPPMEFTLKEIEDIKLSLPELPSEKTKRFVKEFEIREDYAEIIVNDKETSEAFEKIFYAAKKANIKPDSLAGAILNKKVQFDINSPLKTLTEFKISQTPKVSNEKDLESFIADAINSIPKAVEDYKKGKMQSLMAVVGKVMQLSKGTADPQKVKEILIKKLS